ELAGLDLAKLLHDRLDWPRQRDLDRRAPTHLTVPSGSRIAIDYAAGDQPILSVKLQEMFGLAQTPTIADGRVRLVLELLSPAHRPIQVTSDLAGFWAGSYKAVRADLRGRYPRHPWPEEPLAAMPTARAKPRGT
ncbi:MAG: ATP-dependent helicase C-terminal domain-containing protein, partial [Aliidongia sp.]